MTGRVLVAGDANVDLVLRGDIVPRFGQAEQLLDAAELVLGGSASIAACGLARLAVDTHLVAVVGDDEFGTVTRAALTAAGVQIGAVATDEANPTGVSVILSAPSDRSILTLLGTIPLLTADAVRRAVDSTKPDHVHFASYFLQPALAEELPALLRWVRDRGVTTSLDTNWDPAEAWQGLPAVLPELDFLMPNVEELHAIAGSRAGAQPDDESAARSIASRGPRVVVKAGKAGGWSLADGEPCVSAHGLTLDVVDTTGAGDSFDAGYLAAIAHGVMDETTRLRWAAVAGSLSTRGAGGTSAQATLAELHAALAT